MAPEDRLKIKDAFNRAVSRMGPAADEPTDGITDGNGRNLTRRELIESMTGSEDFYQQIEELLARDAKTVDQFVERVEKGAFTLKRAK